MEKLSLAEYYDRLIKHDWYYDFSDDMGLWNKGDNEHNRLVKISLQTPVHKQLFDAFEEYYFSGKPFRTKQKPKPNRPLETI